MDSQNSEASSLLESFGEGLNRHGFGFQYRVIEAISELYFREKSSWAFEVSELPVEVRGTGTRIDFVLRRKGNLNFFIVAECKRANPAFMNWCFVKAPQSRNSKSEGNLIIEKMGFRLPAGFPYSDCHKVFSKNNEYHIAFDVKLKDGGRGDPVGQGKGAIEEAASQACRELNGMVEFFNKYYNALNIREPIFLLPVIFTTAKLWTADINLSEADLTTGKLDFSNCYMEEKPWVIYQYNLSPGLKHTLSHKGNLTGIEDILVKEYVRSIPIVNASGIEDFLSWASRIEINL